MKALITLTHILFPVLIGLAVGGAVSGNTSLMIWGLALLGLDIIIGITLQNIIDKPYTDAWNSPASKEKQSDKANWTEPKEVEVKKEKTNIRQEKDERYNGTREEPRSAENANQSYEKEGESERIAMINAFAKVYIDLKKDGGRQATLKDYKKDEAVGFLLVLCAEIEHAPPLHTLVGLYEVYADKVFGLPTVVYKFLHSENSICENVFIYLVLEENSRIRFFALETDRSRYMLCEYYENRHKNYGVVTLDGAWEKIEEILDT